MYSGALTLLEEIGMMLRDIPLESTPPVNNPVRLGHGSETEPSSPLLRLSALNILCACAAEH